MAQTLTAPETRPAAHFEVSVEPITRYAPVVGRVFLTAIFLMSGVGKIFTWDKTTEKMASEGMVLVPLLLAGAVAFEIVGGLSVLLGCKARWGALLLIAFLIPTTLIFHDFWTFQGEQAQMQMQNFMKNVALLGGLLFVVGFGSGACSLDRLLPAQPNSRALES